MDCFINYNLWCQIFPCVLNLNRTSLLQDHNFSSMQKSANHLCRHQNLVKDCVSVLNLSFLIYKPLECTCICVYVYVYLQPSISNVKIYWKKPPKVPLRQVGVLSDHVCNTPSSYILSQQACKYRSYLLECGNCHIVISSI